jgi:ABC-2 type transport system permease protein
MKGLNEIKIAIGGSFGYLIMMFIIIYGNMVMRSVIEEKLIVLLKLFLRSNLSLMIGKIVGTSLAGILQFLIWAIIGLSLMSRFFFGINATPTAKISPELMQQAQHEFEVAHENAQKTPTTFLSR